MKKQKKKKTKKKKNTKHRRCLGTGKIKKSEC